MEPVPLEMSSNHVKETALDVSDDSKPQQQQQQPSDGRAASPTQTAVVVTPSSAGRRDGIRSRASPTSPPLANGLIR